MALVGILHFFKSDRFVKVEYFFFKWRGLEINIFSYKLTLLWKTFVTAYQNFTKGKSYWYSTKAYSGFLSESVRIYLHFSASNQWFCLFEKHEFQSVLMKFQFRKLIRKNNICLNVNRKKIIIWNWELFKCFLNLLVNILMPNKSK